MRKDNKRPEIAAYAAGFLDGEGHVAVYTQNSGHKQLVINIAQNDRRPLEWLVKYYGGNIYRYTTGKKLSARRCSIWRVGVQEDQLDFLIAVQPYVIVKTEEIEAAIEFLKS